MPREDGNQTKMLRRVWRRRETREAYRRVFATDDGRKVLSDLFRSTGIVSATPALGVEEANYRLGRQSVVAGIVKMTKITEAEIEALAMQEYEELGEDERLG